MQSSPGSCCRQEPTLWLKTRLEIRPYRVPRDWDTPASQTYYGGPSLRNRKAGRWARKTGTAYSPFTVFYRQGPCQDRSPHHNHVSRGGSILPSVYTNPQLV